MLYDDLGTRYTDKEAQALAVWYAERDGWDDAEWALFAQAVAEYEKGLPKALLPKYEVIGYLLEHTDRMTGIVQLPPDDPVMKQVQRMWPRSEPTYLGMDTWQVFLSGI